MRHKTMSYELWDYEYERMNRAMNYEYEYYLRVWVYGFVYSLARFYVLHNIYIYIYPLKCIENKVK